MVRNVSLCRNVSLSTKDKSQTGKMSGLCTSPIVKLAASDGTIFNVHTRILAKCDFFRNMLEDRASDEKDILELPLNSGGPWCANAYLSQIYLWNPPAISKGTGSFSTIRMWYFKNTPELFYRFLGGLVGPMVIHESEMAAMVDFNVLHRQLRSSSMS
jgi:hypothetical protein